MRKLYTFQSIWLLFGTTFAWYTVFTDFQRFYSLYGNITRISDCIIPNPVTTPCFYGAFAFLAAFIWSLFICQTSKNNKVVNQNKLHILLIGSNIFAFTNLFIEVYNFYFIKSSSQISCSGVPASSIFVTPCFIGSMFFLGAFIISKIIKKTNFSLSNNHR